MLVYQLFTPLLYFAIAAAVAGVVHRWVLPLRRSMLLALLVLPLVFTGKALLTGQVYGPYDRAYDALPFSSVKEELGVDGPSRGELHDLYTQIAPWHRAVRHAWSEGDWPLLNPFTLAGDVLLGSAQPAPFYPPNLISLLLPLPLALTFLATLQLYLAALAAFVLCREVGCGRRAALLGAAGWMAMSGTLFWVGWPIGAALALLPATLAAVHQVVRDAGRRSALFLAVALALALLAGHPETAAHHVLVGSFFGLWWMATQPAKGWLRMVAFAFAGGALALAFSAIAVLPLWDTVTQTFEWTRRQALPAAAAESFGELVSRALPNFIPFAHGVPGLRLADLPNFFQPLSGAYVGSLLFAPALLGVLAKPPGDRSASRWLWLVAGLVGLAAGSHLPGIDRLLGLVPPFDTVIHERLIAVTGLALCVLAAFGCDAWLAGRVSGRRLAVLTAAVFLGLVVSLAFLWSSLVERGAGEHLPLHGALLLAPLLLWLPFSLSHRRRTLAFIALLALLLVQRAGEMGNLYPVSRLDTFYPPLAALELPEDLEAPSRFVGFGFTLFPNQAAHYRLEDPRGYQALRHAAFRQTFPLWVAKDGPWWYTSVSDFTRPFLGFLNVRYALTPADRSVGGWQRLRAGEGWAIWRNPWVLERAFLPRRVRCGVQPGSRLEEMSRARSFSEVAWIDDACGELPGDGVREIANGRGELTVRSDGTGYALDARLEEPTWMVVSNVAWRGWRARLANGEEIPVVRANHAFLGLRLPAGEHQVRLFFRPRSFELGLGITALAIAAWLAIGGWRAISRLNASRS
ncbi:MAG: YfhO family protein [Acidobacteriota bacterium]